MRLNRNSQQTKLSRQLLRSRNLPSIYTVGEVFPSGAIIDLVRSGGGSGLKLHFFDGEKGRIGGVVKIGGRLFRPAKFECRVELVRLPTHSSPFGTIVRLFAETRELFARFGFLPEVTFTGAVFCWATWFTDILPIAPRLVITGPTLEAALLLDLISCLARRSLAISEFTRSGISALPLQLQPTLVITAEALSKTSIALFRTSNRRRAYLSVQGNLRDVYCAKVIHCAQIANAALIDPEALCIELLPSTSRLEMLDHETREKIAGQFQPRLLAYRCSHIFDVQHSAFDVPSLGTPTRMLARALGAAVEGATILQDELTSLLRCQEEGQYESYLTDLRYVVVEALLHHAHKDYGARLSVGTITKTVNGILLGRGDVTARDPREIGAKLESLGVRKKRRHDGYSFELDAAFSGRLHKLAHGMGVFASRPGNPDCVCCREMDQSSTTPCEKKVGEQSE